MKLRLLLLTDAVGGVWVYSLELARALQPLGVETVLAVAGPPPTAQQREQAARFRMVDTGLPLEWLETNEAEIRSAGEKLARLAAREAADVVQASSAALIAHAPLDVPCVVVQHSCVATWWADVRGTPLPADFQWRRDLVAHGLWNADIVVAPTQAFADATERTYGLQQPVLAVHNGRAPNEHRALPQGDFVFTASRLWDEGKDVATLDRAAARIAAPFQAAGPTRGPNGANVQFDRLITLGELSAPKLAGVFGARPIFASAALYEPFGLSVLEAAQAGCALVLSDIASHRELWDGAAIFVKPRDDRGFASAIDRLLSDGSERERLGRCALQRARDYTPERTARRMADIYAAVVQPQLVAGAA